MLRTLLSFGIVLLLTQSLLAESTAIDFLRSTGKIYSVVGVIAIIFIGLAIYLWRIDRKLTKIENHIKDE